MSIYDWVRWFYPNKLEAFWHSYYDNYWATPMDEHYKSPTLFSSILGWSLLVGIYCSPLILDFILDKLSRIMQQKQTKNKTQNEV